VWPRLIAHSLSVLYNEECLCGQHKVLTVVAKCEDLFHLLLQIHFGNFCTCLTRISLATRISSPVMHPASHFLYLNFAMNLKQSAVTHSNFESDENVNIEWLFSSMDKLFVMVCG